MFTGPQLSVESASALSATAVRVTYTTDPLQVSSGGAHDALNVSNYTISGPSPTYILSIASVGSDPQSVDLTLGTSMAPGTWTITVANVETPTSTPLNAPFSASFILAQVNVQPPISNGRTNEDAFEVLQQFIGVGVNVLAPGWQALLFGLAQGDQYNWDTAEEAWNERFISTADTIYLSYLGASYGVTRPLNLGLTDNLYRQLIIALKTNKLTESAFLEVLEIFYGVDAVSASATTALAEPFNIATGSQLDVLIDSKFAAVINFANDSFQVPGKATALELAAALTESFDMQGIDAYAVVHTYLGINYVRIYSIAKGGSSAVQVTGGNAQNYLQFPLLLVSADTSQTWTVTQPSYGVARYTTTGATTVDLTTVVPGDYVNVFGASFPAADRGSFLITNVSITYPGSVLTQAFDVDIVGYAQAGIPISLPTDLMIFKPVKNTSFTTVSRSVIVSSQGPHQVDVIIPATTQAVNRTEASAAYLQDPVEIPVSHGVRTADGIVNLTIAANSLVAGQQVFVDNFFSNSSAPINAGNHTTPSGTSDSSLNSQWNAAFTESAMVAGRPAGILLTNGIGFVTGGDNTSTASYNTTNLIANTGHNVVADGSYQIEYTYTAGPTMSVKRSTHRMINLTQGASSGDCLIIAGYDYTGGGTVQTSCDIYHIGPSTISATGALSTARFGHDVVLLNDGRILVAGGLPATSGNATATCEVYNQGAGTWSSTGSMNVKRVFHKLIKLASGQVLCVGGATTNVGPTVNSAELFDPVTNTWSLVGEMGSPRYNPAAYLLADGRALIMGGGDQTTTILAPGPTSMETFDPNTNRFSVVVTGLPVSVGGGSNILDIPGFTCFTDCIPLQNGTQILLNNIASPTNETDPALIFNLDTFKWVIVTPTGFGGSGTITRTLGVAVGPYSDGSVLGAGGLGSGGYIAAFYVPQSDQNGAAGINGLQTLIAGTTSTNLAFQTDFPYYALDTGNATVMPCQAPARQWPGPYIFDPQNGVAITGIQTTTTATYTTGNQYSSLAVADASIFPNEPGYICLAFGLSNQIASLKYFGQQDSLHLLVDFGQVFTQTIPSGSTVTLLAGRGPFIPAKDVPVGQFWLTDSPAGRAGAENAIGEVEAAGVTVEISVTYPGDRGLGAEGYPTTGTGKQSDIVEVFSENYEGLTNE